MELGIFRNSWWETACRKLGHTLHPLPTASIQQDNPYSADLASRQNLGNDLSEKLRNQPPGCLLDNGGAGLMFVSDAGPSSCRLMHEATGLRLISHFIDSIPTAFQSLPWAYSWPCLMSPSWSKGIWDLGHVEELRRFGIPGVFHLPMAAIDQEYDTRPLPVSSTTHLISFVGGQNTGYYRKGAGVEGQCQLPAAIASAVRGDMPGIRFHQVYFDLYEIDSPPSPDDPPNASLAKSEAYYSAKLHYHAWLCVKQRDRFVMFLKRKLADRFLLIGERWDQAYELSCRPPISEYTDYLAHFREAAINLNFVNGNSETGLNMRHFEVTAAGGFLMCYEQEELGRFFEIGKEIESFRNEKELVEKIEFYLAHPERRQEIAYAGQQRTLRDHLYSHRLNTLMKRAGTNSTRIPPLQGVRPAALAHANRTPMVH